MKEFTYSNDAEPYLRTATCCTAMRLSDGLKTGHTASAGYNLIASTQRNDRRLVSVVVGDRRGNSRAGIGQAELGRAVLRDAEDHRCAPSCRDAEGLEGRGRAGAGRFPRRPVRDARPRRNRGAEEVVLNEPLIAPIKQGQAVGKMKVTLNGKPVGEYPLVALQPVEEGGFFRRLIDMIKLWFR